MRLIYILTFVCIASFVFAYYEIDNNTSGFSLAVFWILFIVLIVALFRKYLISKRGI
ncbi:MAG: hypothetical protein ABIP23_00290 [Pelobium sp.]